MIFFKRLSKIKRENEESRDDTAQLRIRAEKSLQEAKDLEVKTQEIVRRIDSQLTVNHFAQRYKEALGGTN